MNKKIIALALATLMLLLSFSACGKKKNMVKIENGKEYEAVTDKKGEYVTSNDGGIAVYVTDEKGTRKKGEDGEYQVNYVKFPDVIVKENIVETETYKLICPKDWEIDSVGRVHPNENSYIQIYQLQNCKGQSDCLETYFSKTVDTVKQLVESIQQQAKGLDASYSVEEGSITEQERPYKEVDYLYKNEAGEILYFSHLICFVYDGYLYEIEYICEENGYDSEFDLISFMNENLIMK